MNAKRHRIGHRRPRADALRRMVRGDAGAALLIVLLFMTVTLILITTMLTLSTNELAISGLQRDSVRAFDAAEAGLVEATRRVEEGRPFVQGFAMSTTDATSGSASVSVIRRSLGVNAAYLEIRAEASAGRAARRLSALVRQQGIAILPNTVLARGVIQRDRAVISCGDVYALGAVQYAADPNRAATRCAGQPPTDTYAGWRISVCANPAGSCDGSTEVPPCYRAPCPAHPSAETSRWYPATRLAVAAGSEIGQDLAAQTGRCPAAGGGPLPDHTITGTLATEEVVADVRAYGFDFDDPDAAGPIPAQAVIPRFLPCGLPYRYIPVVFPQEDGSFIQRYMKAIVYEHWLAAYWRFDARRMAYVKRSGGGCTDLSCLSDGVEPNLAAYPQFGAIPPLPETPTMAGNFNCRKSAAGSLGTLPVACDRPAGRTSTMGCKSPEMACSPAADDPVAIVLDGDWAIDSPLGGHGTLVVTRRLSVPAGFQYWGTVFAGGRLSLGPGAVVLRGNVISGDVLVMGGDSRVDAGGWVPSLPAGRAIVVPRGWWER